MSQARRNAMASSVIAIVIAVVGALVVPAFGADVHEPHVGETCDAGGLWHFVHNQIDEETGPGTLTAVFSITGEVTVGANKVLRSTQHYDIEAAGELISASDDIPEGKLVLSHIDCGEDTTTTTKATTTTTKPTTTSSSIVDTTSSTKPTTTTTKTEPTTTTTTKPSTTTTKTEPTTTPTTKPDGSTTTTKTEPTTTPTTKPDGSTTSTKPPRPPRTTTTDGKGDDLRNVKGVLRTTATHLAAFKA